MLFGCADEQGVDWFRQRAGGISKEADPQVGRLRFGVCCVEGRGKIDQTLSFIVVQLRVKAAFAGAAIRDSVEVTDQGCLHA